MTGTLKTAADVLGIHFLDHLVFSGETFFSYRESGFWGREERRVLG
jgi:DNA repair protein RadC